MKGILLFLLLFVLSYTARSQSISTDSTIFDSSGKVSVIKPVIRNNGNIIPAVSFRLLLQNDNIAKQKARELLLPKVQEAIRIIKSNRYKRSLHEFYMYLWHGSDSTAILNYFTYVESALLTGIAPTDTNTLYQNFIQSFNANLSSSQVTSYYVKFEKNSTLLQLIHLMLLLLIFITKHMKNW